MHAMAAQEKRKAVSRKIDIVYGIYLKINMTSKNSNNQNVIRTDQARRERCRAPFNPNKDLTWANEAPELCKPQTSPPVPLLMS